MLQNCVEHVASGAHASASAPAIVSSISWERRLPVLACDGLDLRELRAEDAGGLVLSVGSPEVCQHIAPPPSTVAGFQQFISWTHKARSEGRHACFGVVPHELGTPVGLFQIWRLDAKSDVAEWGFVLDRNLWGTGVFERAAELVVQFAFESLRVERIEGRASIDNGRGNGALRKLGAGREGVLRRCFELHGQRVDHVLWALLSDEWRERRG